MRGRCHLLFMSTIADSRVSIRASGSEDSATIRRLAALDSAPVPHGSVLLAEVEGRVLAAVSLADGRAIADPFAETQMLVELLRVAAGRRPLAVAR
jgi:hypothetical protein